MRPTLIVLLTVLLPACAMIPETKTVTVPVRVACIEQRITPPIWATDQLPLNASLLDKVKALLAERLQRIGYEAELNAQIEGCL
mgnify:CR=1 FL=1